MTRAIAAQPTAVGAAAGLPGRFQHRPRQRPRSLHPWAHRRPLGRSRSRRGPASAGAGCGIGWQDGTRGCCPRCPQRTSQGMGKEAPPRDVCCRGHSGGPGPVHDNICQRQASAFRPRLPHAEINFGPTLSPLPLSPVHPGRPSSPRTTTSASRRAPRRSCCRAGRRCRPAPTARCLGPCWPACRAPRRG